MTEFERAVDYLDGFSATTNWDTWRDLSTTYESANGLKPIASLSPQEAGQPRLAALDTEEFDFDASKALVDATVEDKKALPVVDKKDEKLA